MRSILSGFVAASKEFDIPRIATPDLEAPLAGSVRAMGIHHTWDGEQYRFVARDESAGAKS